MSDDAVDRAQRVLEEGISTDFSKAMSYGAYLDLDTLLAAQHPRSEPQQHDELLFIIQHQVAELWLKLLLHEMHSARALIAADELAPALKRLARVKHVQKQLVEQWDVLATLTPSEYAQIRPFLATSSGFQSHQYRAVEFLLGNKNADMVRLFEHSPHEHAELMRLLGEPTIYDEFLRFLARRGYPVPAAVLERDVTQPYRLDEDLAPCSRRCTPRRPSTGGSTRPAKSSSTSRTCSNSGASATSRSSPAPSGTGRAPVGRAASASCARPWTSPSSPSCTRCAPSWSELPLRPACWLPKAPTCRTRAGILSPCLASSTPLRPSSTP